MNCCSLFDLEEPGIYVITYLAFVPILQQFNMSIAFHDSGLLRKLWAEYFVFPDIS